MPDTSADTAITPRQRERLRRYVRIADRQIAAVRDYGDRLRVAVDHIQRLREAIERQQCPGGRADPAELKRLQGELDIETRLRDEIRADQQAIETDRDAAVRIVQAVFGALGWEDARTSDERARRLV